MKRLTISMRRIDLKPTTFVYIFTIGKFIPSTLQIAFPKWLPYSRNKEKTNSQSLSMVQCPPWMNKETIISLDLILRFIQKKKKDLILRQITLVPKNWLGHITKVEVKTKKNKKEIGYTIKWTYALFSLHFAQSKHIMLNIHSHAISESSSMLKNPFNREFFVFPSKPSCTARWRGCSISIWVAKWCNLTSKSVKIFEEIFIIFCILRFKICLVVIFFYCGVVLKSFSSL